MGDFLVSKDQKAEFLALIRDSLATLRELADDGDYEAVSADGRIATDENPPPISQHVTPPDNPKQILVRRKKEMGIASWMKLALMARKVLICQQEKDREDGILGSAREFVRSGILRGLPRFLKSDVFNVGSSHALYLEE
jgi:hypothetical protein